MDLAEHLPERSRYLSAAKQLAMAVRLTKKPEEIAEFSLWHARALAAAGEYTAAVKVAGGPHAEEEHHFLQCCCLFLAYQQGQSELAVQLEAAYKRFAKQWPQSPYLLWCEEMVARIQKPQSVKLGLLLVGIDEYQYVGDLNGCVNDMRLFGDTLSRIWPADSLVVRQIANKEATKANILQAFDEVGSQLGLEDRFIFYYVGHAMKEDDHFIVAHDAKVQAELVEQVIGFSELHEKMLQIPTSAKGLVLDTDGHPQLTQFAQDKQLGYGLYFGSSPGQNAMETQIGGQTHGVFTYSLVEIIQQIEDNEAWERLPMMVTSLVRQRMDNQDPLFFKPGMILSREMRQDIFVDLVEYCEGEVKHIDEARVKSLLNFALKKG
ncbi:MAG: caspase family protein, partial [Bacteroidota bacterium]